MSTRPLVALALILLAGSIAAADEPKLPDAKEFDKLVVASLRDVHNAGANLYNTKKEFEGTYRMYEGALAAVRPLLAHRPKAQKLIEDGFAAADKESSMAQKAFRLHETIEAVRAFLRTGEPAKKPVEKQPPREAAPPPRLKKM